MTVGTVPVVVDPDDNQPTETVAEQKQQPVADLGVAVRLVAPASVHQLPARSSQPGFVMLDTATPQQITGQNWSRSRALLMLDGAGGAAFMRVGFSRADVANGRGVKWPSGQPLPLVGIPAIWAILVSGPGGAVELGYVLDYWSE